MDSNDESKEIDMNNRTCYYFDDFNLDNILIEEKAYENILVYNISYKNLIAKLLRIRFDKIDGFIKIYDGTRYLVLFASQKKNDSIYSRIRYLTSVKSGITYIILHNYAKIKVNSYNSLPLEKTMPFHDVLILIKSDFDKDKVNYYYNIFLEKASYELPLKSFCIKHK